MKISYFNNKKFFLVIVVFLFLSAVGMNKKDDEIIFIPQKKGTNNFTNLLNQFENPTPEVTEKNNGYSKFDKNCFTSINEKPNSPENPRTWKEKHQSDSGSIDFNADFSDLPNQKKDLKIENFEQLSNVISVLDDKVNNIEKTMELRFDDVAGILYKFLTDIHKTHEATDAKIANIDDYLNSGFTRLDMQNKIFSNKMQGLIDSVKAVSECMNLFLQTKKFKTTIKSLRKVTSQDIKVTSKQQEKSDEKNKKISSDKKIKQANKKLRFSINKEGTNTFSLDDNGRNSPNEYDEFFSSGGDSTNSTKSTLNDSIGGSIYNKDQRKSQSAEDLKNKRKSTIIRKNSAEIENLNSKKLDQSIDDKKIGIITPRRSSKGSITSQDSSTAINAESEYPDNSSTETSISKKSSENLLRISSESNQTK